MEQPNSDQMLQQFLALEQERPDSHEVLFTLGALYQNRKDLERAGAYYVRGLALDPAVWEAWVALAGIRTVQGLYAEAAAHYQQALQRNPAHQPAWFGLANLLSRQQREAELESCYQEILIRFPSLQQTPSIFFNTLPRSASIFVTTALRVMLRREFLMVAEIDSADNQIYELNTRLFAQGGVITQAHLPASPHNLAIMNRYLERLVIQIRDPRQAVLSLVYLFRRRQQAGPEQLRFSPPIPADYLDWELPAQIDWNLQHYYPILIRWIEGWLDVQEQGLFRGQLLLTRYEDFLADATGFYLRLLDFHGLTALSPDLAGMAAYTPPPGYLNYRKGERDEWREVFSPVQADWATGQLPPRTRRLFEID